MVAQFLSLQFASVPNLAAFGNCSRFGVSVAVC